MHNRRVFNNLSSIQSVENIAFSISKSDWEMVQLNKAKEINKQVPDIFNFLIRYKTIPAFEQRREQARL